MPNYLSVAEYQAATNRQYPKLYDNAGTPDTAWMEADINAAEGRIDGYLSARYATPVTGGDIRLLMAWTRLLALGMGMTRKPSGEVPDGLTKEIDRVYADLKAVAAGKMQLGGTELPAEVETWDDAIIVEGNEPEMTRAKLGGF